ncbi:MAG: addiction module protein [Verrucomicrobiota bacterium]
MPGDATAVTFQIMKLQEIQNEALSLSDEDRAALALSLLETLAVSETDLSDEEALRRDAEMESGKVKPQSHEEFVRRVQQARGK